MFKGHDFLGRYDIIANIQALNVTLFEGVCEHLNVIHNDKVVADIQVLELAIPLADDLTQLVG